MGPRRPGVPRPITYPARLRGGADRRAVAQAHWRWDLPRGVGGVVLHFSDLLCGPLAELLGLGALGAPALRQEVVDGLHVHHAQHVHAEGCQQVPAGKDQLSTVHLDFRARYILDLY